MSKLLKNITKISLSIITAFAVLTLNFTAFVHCSTISMSDDCCHVSQTVKKCCVKDLKITASERISAHCGCSMKQAPEASVLYIDHNNFTRENNHNNLQYESASSSVFSSSSIHTISADYSPPNKCQSDLYLTNLSIRI